MGSVTPPPLHVDHVSVAVRAIEPMMTFLTRYLPITQVRPPRRGHDGQFLWTDFFIGDWKLGLIASACPDSFVERFVAKRGEGLHHLSIDVAADRLDAYADALAAGGLRIVDRTDFGEGDKMAFISPRSTPGILIQFWQVPGFQSGVPSQVPTEPVAQAHGVKFRVDHVALAVQSIEATLAWWQRWFPIEVTMTKRRGWDGTLNVATFWLANYKLELIEPAAPESFVARFLTRYGEGFHHLAIDVDHLAPLVARLEEDGIRIVDEAELGGGRATAFISPRDAHGVLIQFWQEPDFGTRRRR